MSKNDFYVSLPSNVSMKTYPNNKQSNYTTLLEEPLFLPLNFQVALVEISNFSDFKVQMGKISFKNPFYGNIYDNRIENIEFSFDIENGISLKDFCEKVNYEIQNNCIKNEYLFRQAIAYNFDQKITNLMHLTNMAKNLSNRPFLNVLKISSSRYEVIDLEKSIFCDFFFECGAFFDSNLSRFVFKNLEILENKFNLLILNVPSKDEINSRSYYIDKKYLILSDVLVLKKNDIKLISKRNESDALNLESFRQDSQNSPIEASNSIFFHEIWNSLPQLKQLDNNTITIETKNEIKFEGLISKVLNNSDNDYTVLNFSEIFNLPSYLQLIKYILIYTDIIESQYYGDVRASILRTVNIKSKKGDNVTFFDNPHYLNISKTRIDSINIEIRDINGNHIEFKDLFSNIYISLHFKHRNY